MTLSDLSNCQVACHLHVLCPRPNINAETNPDAIHQEDNSPLPDCTFVMATALAGLIPN